ncbi:MAG TPA: T9SS type A sorting domain-containing protein [Ignavibacteriaceae bacterium]|nr:T9SS type A sorting domain-containing protein [Ignavibacteriaceae bacterium]
MRNLRTYFILFFVLALATNVLNAQWVPTNGPAEYTNKLVIGVNSIGDTNLYASSYNRVFLTTNNGDDWTAIDGYNGFPDSGFTSSEILTLAVDDSFLFAGTNGAGIFLSINNDTNWIPVNNGLTNLQVLDILISDTFLFAATSGGVYRSTNNGTDWINVNNGLPDTIVGALAVNLQGRIFASIGISEGVYQTTNNGNNWMNTNYNDVYSPSNLIFSNEVLYASTVENIFRSSDDGTNWVEISNGLPNSQITCLESNDTIVYAGTEGDGVYYCLNGFDWISGFTGGASSVHTLVRSSTYLFAGVDASFGDLRSVWKRPLSEMLTGVGDKINQIYDFYLEQNFPNPFNPHTTISFSLSKRSFVILRVFDCLGELITTLVSEELSVGNHSRQWNGDSFSSGLYFYTLQSGSFSETKKMLYLK